MLYNYPAGALTNFDQKNRCTLTVRKRVEYSGSYFPEHQLVLAGNDSIAICFMQVTLVFYAML